MKFSLFEAIIVFLISHVPNVGMKEPNTNNYVKIK